MQTNLLQELQATPEGAEAERILRNCVHCGFCNATCPTYQLLGDELDGPRGRIYLMKDMLEGGEVSRHTQRHLDRCLTCRNCETTCPSGVEYGKLVDIGRELVEERVRRPWRERLFRGLLRRVLPEPGRFAPLLGAGRAARPLLPAGLKAKVPEKPAVPAWPEPRHPRRMVVLEGCVQPALSPQINAHAARILDRLGISLVTAPGAGCCGAVDQHLGAPEAAAERMRANIDAWWPHIEAGAEAVVMTASGCGALVREYAHHLRDDPDYAERAARISALTRDLGEVLAAEDLAPLRPERPPRVAFQSPCTLQHAQGLNGVVEDVLRRLGLELTPVAEPHLCCGSAGTYSLLQPELAASLRDRKLANLGAGEPEAIATANIGCLHHLDAASPVPVRHWAELLDTSLPPTA
ncbi:glycolate oxidase iron-sulfur subunit [Thiohalorhabdus denitrificans]|uniref:Glycolate oxidase iron-sulfur subunit n=1 Tax=Thiohalorhabdus denitrificans TaxID=381306 RepID=A0A0N8PNH0_9GAMM|nr:glycolate oxidase subunit GlcF [Thiohalorhabdus denitrificans]KPV41501.1 glycolate oxidase iron-sulfur subunit [Thiohalorhabdus denitrificans]SCY29565.1 glycolate oxidase iron-sulfur subunit [Thiohalorhabdus denitrificans]